MNLRDALKIIPQWIIAIAFCILVLSLLLSLFTGYQVAINGHHLGFVRETRDDALLLVGSGTVYNYLRARVGGFLNDSANVIVLEGATGTGAKVISDAFFHGRDTTQRVLPMIAMAAKELQLKDFNLVGDDRFLEVQIGVDTMKVTFGASSKEAFLKTFVDKGLVQMPSSADDRPLLTVSALRPWVYSYESQSRFLTKPMGYEVAITGSGSATRQIFDSLFRKPGAFPDSGWPIDADAFDLDFQKFTEIDTPWIALGSELLNAEKINDLQKDRKGIQCIVSSDNNQPVVRKLYLYTRLPRHPVNIALGGGRTSTRYMIDPQVSLFLTQLFDALRKEVTDKSFDSLLVRQMAFLHLNTRYLNRGWIEDSFGGRSRLYKAVKQEP